VLACRAEESWDWWASFKDPDGSTYDPGLSSGGGGGPLAGAAGVPEEAFTGSISLSTNLARRVDLLCSAT